MKIIWTGNALSDLRKIHDALSRESVYFANRHIECLLEVEKIIGLNPEAGSPVPEYVEEDILEYAEGNYRIFYTYRSSTVRILTIMHGARLLSV